MNRNILIYWHNPEPMKTEYRTTIIFDKEMRRKIKLHQVDHDDSMKTIIYQALNHYFDNEVKKSGKQ